jgi:hypothetical protein
MLRRVTENIRAPWDALRGTSEPDAARTNEPPGLRAGGSDGPMGASELIAWHLQNGATMQALRAMFPAFFEHTAAGPEPGRGHADFHEPELWQWNTVPHTDNGFDDFQYTGQNDFHPHL